MQPRDHEDQKSEEKKDRKELRQLGLYCVNWCLKAHQ